MRAGKDMACHAADEQVFYQRCMLPDHDQVRAQCFFLLENPAPWVALLDDAVAAAHLTAEPLKQSVHLVQSSLSKERAITLDLFLRHLDQPQLALERDI